MGKSLEKMNSHFRTSCTYRLILTAAGVNVVTTNRGCVYQTRLTKYFVEKRQKKKDVRN